MEFSAIQNIELDGKYGLAGKDLAVTAELFEEEDGEINEKKLQVTVARTNVDNSRGSIILKGINVQPEGRDDAEMGEVSVTVSGASIEEASAVVGEVKEFGVDLSVEEVVTLTGGKEEKAVTVTLEETVVETLNPRHDAFFEIEGGIVKADTLKVALNGEAIEVEKVVNEDDATILEGFVVDFATIDETKANTFTVKFEVEGYAGKAETVTVTGESRSFGEDKTVEVATITAPVTVAQEAATLKVGLKGQTGGKITITEAAEGMIEKGLITIEMDEAGITFDNEEDIIIETTGTLEVEVKDMDEKAIVLEVVREAKEAATLSISGFTYDVDRMVPEGSVDMEIGGSALTNVKGDVIVSEDFIVIGTPNTEDNNGTQIVKGETTFKVGTTTFVLNGEAKEMDAAPYITEKSRVMVPVRYVSEAFGIAGNDVLFSQENGGTITLFVGNRVVQVVNGSNVALVNGVEVPMEEAVTIKDGRTYIPMGEMARLLDVQVEWNNDTKEAMFKN